MSPRHIVRSVGCLLTWGLFFIVSELGCHSVQAQSAPETRSSSAIEQLSEYLKANRGADFDVKKLEAQDFASSPLSREESAEAKKLLAEHHRNWVKENRKQEMEELELRIGEHKMPFWFKVFGDKPEGGRSLYISMHGGGGAPKRVNDGQWENQKKLYTPEEGVYVAPRAPVDAWNMWHVAEVDALFQRLVEDMIVFHDVNPDRVYLMGYSAGGDGVYQIAPRWADHLAAAAMMAGHPNETTADGLRNLPFCLQMGGKDAAYDRNKIAKEWEEKLKELQGEDPQGYTHLVKIYPEYGHWMNREDAIAIDWMAKFNRVRNPDRIVWKQDDVIHRRFYWLTNQDAEPKAKSRVVVVRQGQNFNIESVVDVERLGLLLDDEMGVNLDSPIVIAQEGDGAADAIKELRAERKIGTLAGTLWQSGDPLMMAAASLAFEVVSSEESQE